MSLEIRAYVRFVKTAMSVGTQQCPTVNPSAIPRAGQQVPFMRAAGSRSLGSRPPTPASLLSIEELSVCTLELAQLFRQLRVRSFLVLQFFQSFDIAHKV